MIFFLSPVGAVGCDTDFHLIDQGKVGYLYHLQILLFNLQDASSSSSILWLGLQQYNNDGRTGTIDNCYGVITVSNSIIVMLTSYDTVYDLYFDTVFDGRTGTNEAMTADKITNIFWLRQLKLISYIPCTVSSILQAIIACENNIEPSS